MNKITIYLLIVLFLAASPILADSTPIYETLVVPETSKKVEFIWAKPEGSGPWPLLVMIHPHQEWPNKIGASAFINNGALKIWPQKGWLTVALSQPGYGKSDGPADFCGPLSQQAAQTVIDHFRKMDIVKKDSIVVYGGSRGAVVAAIIATQDSRIAGFILRSGLYDFLDAYQEMPWYSSIKFTMRWEIGWNNTEGLKKRSALYFADKVKAPILLFHGEHDDRAPLKYAKQFTEKARANGADVQLITFNAEHIIPPQKIIENMEAFMKKLK